MCKWQKINTRIQLVHVIRPCGSCGKETPVCELNHVSWIKPIVCKLCFFIMLEYDWIRFMMTEDYCDYDVATVMALVKNYREGKELI